MPLTAMQRIGMYGGAFDPPHLAHRALAQAALDQLQLQRLFVFPTGDAWHKARTLSPAAHRLAMARLAFQDLAGAVVDERELRRSGPTYSVDTLGELAAEHPQAALFLLMGADQAASFTRWHAWEEIARRATLCVAGRGADAAAMDALQALAGVRLVRLQMPLMDLSATEIRARLTAGQDITPLVDPRVASYIARHHLYSPS